MAEIQKEKITLLRELLPFSHDEMEKGSILPQTVDFITLSYHHMPHNDYSLLGCNKMSLSFSQESDILLQKQHYQANYQPILLPICNMKSHVKKE